MSILASAESKVLAVPSSPCKSCGLPLPVRRRETGESSQKFICVRCGNPCKGVFIEDSPPDIATNALRTQNPAADQDPQQLLEKVAAPLGTAKKVARRERTPDCAELSPMSKKLDMVLTQPDSLAVKSAGPAFSDTFEQHGATPYDPEVQLEQVESFEESLEQVEGLVAALEQGRSIDAEAHESIARDTIAQAASDLDFFVRLGVNPMGEGYPGRHSLHVSMLAAGIGASLGWDHDTLIELGVGCLIHDLGMVLVPDKVYDREQVLSPAEFSSIASHPITTFDLIEEHVSTVPLTSRMVAYQIHERVNASGYPRKRSAPLIHEAAKVAAVADVYVALVSPRPYRPGVMPYHAVEHLLRGVRVGLFCAETVRALLRTISLFPIGSYVTLSDKRVARVIRTSPQDYTRPIVEAWRADELDAPPEIIELSKQTELRVARALSSLSAA